jgi:hypothetical protein
LRIERLFGNIWFIFRVDSQDWSCWKTRTDLPSPDVPDFWSRNGLVQTVRRLTEFSLKLTGINVLERRASKGYCSSWQFEPINRRLRRGYESIKSKKYVTKVNIFLNFHSPLHFSYHWLSI